ncbi:tensin-4-like, partial [Chrysoperla carnea]|uniref:tensin-4-like n=1 Tax=Chrysoperla carnea TaxID=189513 RepID=UPI001D0715D4
MGRLGKASTSTARPMFRVQYRKLVDDYSCKQTVKFMSNPQQLPPPFNPDYLAYPCCHCGHTLKLKAEELNSIVGNAFRMAYAAEIQRQPSFQEVIVNQLQELPGSGDKNSKCGTSSGNRFAWTKHLLAPSAPTATATKMNVQLSSAHRLGSVATKRPPTSIPGLRPNHSCNVLCASATANTTTSIKTSNDDHKNILISESQQSTPSSEESNSPTDMNSYKRLQDKPPLIKRIQMGLTNGGGSFMLNNMDEDNDSCPLVVHTGSTPNSPTAMEQHNFTGYVNEVTNTEDNLSAINKINDVEGDDIKTTVNTKHIELECNRLLKRAPSPHHAQTDASNIELDFKSKRISQISSSSSALTESSLLGGSTPAPTPPPLPERTDSLNNKEEGELRTAPWFQAGIPREITLEVLDREPVGAFMVRESTSKPGCYALSLRVPRDFQPSGIAHYLIIRTNKGYKIKGFTKEFTTLTALITHHSVMPELLPCPLSLSRFNPNFAKSDSNRDFADIDSDPDYNTLADFRKMMSD